MDTETRQSLGGAIVAVVLLAVGLVMQVSEADAMKGIGGALMIGGGVLLGVLALRFAAKLMSPAND